MSEVYTVILLVITLGDRSTSPKKLDIFIPSYQCRQNTHIFFKLNQIATTVTTTKALKYIIFDTGIPATISLENTKGFYTINSDFPTIKKNGNFISDLCFWKYILWNTKGIRHWGRTKGFCTQRIWSLGNAALSLSLSLRGIQHC